MTARNKTLLITRNFPPLVGGMEHLIFNSAVQLSKTFDVSVVGPPGGEKFVSDDITYRAARAKKPMLLSLLSLLTNAIVSGRKIRPNIVFCGSGLVAPIGYLCAKLVGAKCAVYLHGLDIVVDSWVYQNIFMFFTRRFDLVIANSDSSYKSAVERGIPEDKLTIQYPGTDVPGYHPENCAEFKDDLGLSDKKLVLYIGRITKRKGLLEFVQNCAVELIKSTPDIHFLIVGDNATQSIVANDPIIEKLQAFLDENNIQQHFTFYGETTDRTIVANAYWSSELLIFPVHYIADDIEGFGMVAVEAAAHGIPTVAFRVGGLVNSVNEGQSGLLVDYPDYTALADKVIAIIDGSTAVPRDGCIEHGHAHSWEKFGQSLRQKIAALLDEQ